MLDDAGTTDSSPLDAGSFDGWLARFQASLRASTRPVEADADASSDVPCGTCRACCEASQFVHIEPDETATLARIPAARRVPAPGLPAGHVVLGYDQRGRCPMLTDAGCSIYDDRPRTCRQYDCRVFAATGLTERLAQEPTKVAIASRARRWRFTSPESAGAQAHQQARQQAVRATATFLADHPDLFGGTAPPATPLAAVAAQLGEVHALAAHGRLDRDSVAAALQRGRTERDTRAEAPGVDAPPS